ncbi:hypothetical protein BJ138DRAFT_1120270 [Hygrophoropsis aurantiaca]|uniref:Uncharacterized protein n=1 Tax=Hygrophoropsis aurantiaca TaxID=72124 RepID=A0ACB7ZS65_9AGAM|nr:hypothetical protein BJ138DRAFT_1120270 [Hygrophoropsis aurantiaca]
MTRTPWFKANHESRTRLAFPTGGSSCQPLSIDVQERSRCGNPSASGVFCLADDSEWHPSEDSDSLGRRDPTVQYNFLTAILDQRLAEQSSASERAAQCHAELEHFQRDLNHAHEAYQQAEYSVAALYVLRSRQDPSGPRDTRPSAVFAELLSEAGDSDLQYIEDARFCDIDEEWSGRPTSIDFSPSLLLFGRSVPWPSKLYSPNTVAGPCS